MKEQIMEIHAMKVSEDAPHLRDVFHFNSL